MLSTPHPPLTPPSPRELQAHHRRAARRAGLSIERFVAPTSLHIVVEGLRLHVLDWGTDACSATTPTIMFLHGGGQTARTWDLSCLALRRRYRCIAVDQRGHGDSEWSLESDYRPSRHARDFLGILDHLEIPQTVVVGMSMGCLNGLEFALENPDRTSRFVAIDAGPWVELGAARSILDFTESSDGADSMEDLVRMTLQFNPRRDASLLATSLRHNVRRRPDGKLTWKTDRRRGLQFDEMSLLLHDLQRRVCGLRCPTLILRGSQSQIFSDADAQRFASSVLRGRWERIPGAGHIIQGDNPSSMVEAIEHFLSTE